MNKTFSDIGIVIRVINFGEADRFVDIVSQDHGLINLIAKGVRRITSKKAPHLDLLNLIKFQVARGRSPQIITQAELIEPHLNLKNNLKMARTSFYLIEILNSLLAPEQPDKELFLSLKNYLFHLNKTTSKEKSRKLSINFQLYLFRHLGFPEPKEKTPQAIMSHLENITSKKIKSRHLL
jgi:DNA repair protein RecO (recombination protein O)